MKALTIKKLQQNYVGKIATVLTIGIGKTLTDQQFADFFTGRVDAIDEDGIYTTHALTGCKNFFAFPHVIGILEEQVITEDNPEYHNLVEEVKKKQEKRQAQQVPPNLYITEPPPGAPPPPSQYAEIDVMADLARQAKEIEDKLRRT